MPRDPPSFSKSFAPTFTDCSPVSSANARTLPLGSPAEASTFLKNFLPFQKPPHFQLAADELETLPSFKHHRESVVAFARTRFPNLLCQPEPRLKARRHWERSLINELKQHDFSIHQWWVAQEKQTLLLTMDDHFRKLLGAVFVPTDTTYNQF